MKTFLSWNVNGLRACVKKGFEDTFRALDADLFCLQETKLQEGQIDLSFDGYHQYWNYAERKGYSGTCIFTKEEPLSVRYGMNVPELDTEGRLITLEFPEYYFLTEYVPNAQNELKRIDFRMQWEDAFRAYVCELKKDKPVILCGDLNVAHQEIDLKNPKTNRGNAGFSDEERGKFGELLDAGFTDTFRYRYPDATGIYSWWSYRFNARKNNAGWRIDYFVVSNDLNDHIVDAKIHTDVLGSDHCPVELQLDL
ncbi:MAG: exodeoxyribonuclease III [Clostridia bacterium]|nr:exodeoxyribonuclease III [Clostridia bacterium]